jgi:hypothetical protein
MSLNKTLGPDGDGYILSWIMKDPETEELTYGWEYFETLFKATEQYLDLLTKKTFCFMVLGRIVKSTEWYG